MYMSYVLDFKENDGMENYYCMHLVPISQDYILHRFVSAKMLRF